MDPELYLYVEKVRARELRAEAERRRRAPRSSVVRAWETRLGWVLVEMGLRLVRRRPVPY